MSTSAPVTLETLPEAVKDPVSVEVQTSETMKAPVRAGTLDVSSRKFDVASVAKFDFTPIMPASAPITLETLPEMVEEPIHTPYASRNATLDVAPKIAIPKVTPIKPSTTPVTLETLPEMVEDLQAPVGSRAVLAATLNASDAISFRSYPPKIMTPRFDILARSSQKTLGILPEILEVPVPLNTPAATPDSATLDVELETVSIKDPGEVTTPTQDLLSPAPMDKTISSMTSIIDPFAQINVPDVSSAFKVPSTLKNKIKVGAGPTNISSAVAPALKTDNMSKTPQSESDVKREAPDAGMKTLSMTPDAAQNGISGGAEQTADVAYDASSGVELDNLLNVARKPSTSDALTGGNGMTYEPATAHSTPSPASEAIFTVDAMPEASGSVNRIRPPPAGRVLPYHTLFKSLVCCFAPHTATH